MIYYEIKKVFSKTSNRVALAILAIILCIVVGITINGVEYVNDKGETETGFTAIQKLKEEKKKWTGELTEDKIKAVISEELRINQTEEYNSKDIEKNNIAYSWKQGFEDIRDMINSIFTGFRRYDYYTINSLSEEDAKNFYPNRLIQVKSYLKDNDNFSEQEKDYIIKQYENLKTPIYYDYCEGWKQLSTYSVTMIMISTLAIGFIVSGIFSSEINLKADSIFFSSYYGRNKAIKAKGGAGLVIVTAIYFIIMMIYTAIILGVLGIDGANCPIQIDVCYSLYNITFLQEYIFIVLGGYLGCLSISLISMFISAKVKSSTVAVAMPFILIFAPSFISSENIIIEKILGILPDQLLQIQYILSRKFTLYNIFSKVVNQGIMLIIIYIILSIIIYHITYRTYKKVEVK